MNVVISAGGRFHALELAAQLQKRRALKALFTFDYGPSDNSLVNPCSVHIIKSCKIINDAFVKLQLARFVPKASFNMFKDNLFDMLVSKQLAHLDHIDIFVGWAHYTLNSIPTARKAGAIIIIESGSCHILEQQQLLQEEYKKFGLHYNPTHPKTIEKMLAEYQQADVIMTLSSFAQQSFIKQGLPPHKIYKIPCGINIDFFLHHKIFMHKKKFRVIFVGLVTLRKGVHHLIQAWAQAKLPQQNAELFIVGAIQQDFRLIQQKLSIPSNVILVGPKDRETLRQYLQQSSLFVLPSIEDGFGMVIAEAMASGLPVICSKNTAGVDIIENGKHGFLIDAGDIKYLAEKIQWCFENQEDAALIGLCGQKHIQSFSWNVYGERIYQMYTNILKMHNHHKQIIGE